MLGFDVLACWEILVLYSCGFRKEHLHELCYQNMVVGIGGPGAPHVYSFDRLNDVRSLQFKYDHVFLVGAGCFGNTSVVV